MTSTFLIDVKDLPTRLQEVLSMVTAGDKEILLTDQGKVVAQLVPLPPPESLPPRIAPLHPGSIWMSDDFDDPLPDEFWEGES